MRIAMVSTLTRPVPPKAEGSVEMLVHQLTEHLVAQGHDVTLFALPESKTSARLVSPVETSYVNDPMKWDWQLYESYQVREAFQRWQEFDVINCHSYHFGMMYCDFVPIPSIHSFHVDLGPDYRFLADRTQNRHLQFCSRFQARDFADVANTHIIPHGINVSHFSVAKPEHRESYLAWIGRFHPEKGVMEAIDIARRSGYPLKMAGPANEYLRQVVLPGSDPAYVEYVGEVGGSQKEDFLSKAHALLYPLERGEPFGLVLIEAMACGLPVVAYDKGAVPEIVDHTLTGYLGTIPDDLITGIKTVSTFDREHIRSIAEDRFSSFRMASQMEMLMYQVTGANALQAATKVGL